MRAVVAVTIAAMLQAPQPAPVFRAGTTYVPVDVVAVDADGRPVTDLQKSDFEIREGGRAQEIADFAYVSVPAGNRPVDLTGVPSAPADVFSNARPPRTARAFAIVMHHVAPAEIVRTKRVLQELLRGLRPEDRVAFVYPGRSDLSQDFTNEESLLVRAVNNMRASLGGGAVARWDLYFRNVLQSLAATPESRRAVILVSDAAVPSRDQDILGDSRRLNVPIYTFDPRGLLAPELGLDGHIEDQTPERRAGLDTGVRRAQDSMRELAGNTNGRAYVNRWDPAVAVRELLADNSSYYVLGFYPNPAVPDGKFHDIDVRVRRPGVRIRSRAGYLADKPPSRKKALPAIVQDLGAGSPGGDLTISATAAALEARGKRTSTLLTFTVAAPPAAAGGERLQFAWIAIDVDGGIKASGQNEVRLQESDIASQETIVVNDLLDLPDKEHLTIRLAVSSDRRGARGVVHVPCDVGAIHDGPVRATPLLVEAGHSRVRPRVIGAAVSPLPFQPTTRRAFSRSETLHAFVRLFSSEPGALTGTVTVRRRDAVVASIPATMSASTTSAPAMDASADVTLSEFEPGAYVMTFTATAPGGASVTRAIPFTVR